jgi:hypothetical protein
MTRIAAGVITSYITDEKLMAKNIGPLEHPTHDEIAQSAYRMYEVRGRADGHDLEDWLMAEKELKHHYA